MSDWKFVANLGDENPLEHGGLFVFTDGNEVKLERLEPNDDGTYDWRWGIIDRCIPGNGFVSDNKFHPETPAWFSKPEWERAHRPQDTTYLRNVADYCGTTVEELSRGLCSADPVELANAYCNVFEYHGWDNFDSYPVALTRTESEEKYCKYLSR